jgi:peroxiredoxin
MVFNIKNCNDEKMLLAINYREKLILKDSAFNNGKCTFIFENSGAYDAGMYTLVSGRKNRILNFIIDHSRSFTFNMDTTGNVHDFTVVGSHENAEMLRFQRKTIDAQNDMTAWGTKRKEFEKNGMKDSADYYVEKMKSRYQEMEEFISELIDKNPTFLFSKLQKSYREIEIPEPPVYEDGSIDSTFQIAYYRTHYWDNFDLTDRRFLFLPSYEPKLHDYFKKILWHQEVDTINKYMDLMLKKTSPDSLMYRFLVEYLTSEFDQSNIIGHDAVLVHIAKNNQLAGKCTWIEEDFLKKIKMRVEDLEPVLIGTKSVELVLSDTSENKWFSSYSMPQKYRVLWFYDHSCQTCTKESKELKAVYDSLANIGQLNFDVFAVNRTDDFDRWKKYIRDNGFKWINVGGKQGNVDWMEVYRIKSTPQLFIINQDKMIILNKNIPKNMIPQFLMENERMEAEKARLKNKKR